MFGGGGYDVSIISVVSPHGSVSASSLHSYSYAGSSSKPSHYSLPSYLGDHHINEFFTKRRGRNRHSLVQSRRKPGVRSGGIKRG